MSTPTGISRLLARATQARVTVIAPVQSGGAAATIPLAAPPVPPPSAAPQRPVALAPGMPGATGRASLAGPPAPGSPSSAAPTPSAPRAHPNPVAMPALATSAGVAARPQAAHRGMSPERAAAPSAARLGEPAAPGPPPSAEVSAVTTVPEVFDLAAVSPGTVPAPPAGPAVDRDTVPLLPGRREPPGRTGGEREVPGGTRAEAVPPVVIGRIEVQVTPPIPAPDPFAGCRAVEGGLTARQGGGW